MKDVRQWTEMVKVKYEGNIFYEGRYPHGYLFGFDKAKGIWREISPDVAKFLRQKLPCELLSSGTISEVMADICQSLYWPDPPQEPAWNLINFGNGVWDIKAGRFVKDDENLLYPPFFLSRIASKFDPNGNADLSRIDGLFKEWVGDEHKILLYELIGYALLRCQSAQKFFNLYGPGDNGKSTFVRLLRRLIGPDNCSSLAMDEIMGDRFALSQLRGKLINITGELSPTLRRTDKIKLLTGEDPVFAQEKFKAGFSFVPYAKLIFMGNIVPSTPDSSTGFYRRTLILPFLNTIPPEKKDPQLLHKITEEEIEGLLRKAALEILPPFIEREFRFTVDPSVEELETQWEGWSNPLQTFVEEYFETAPGKIEFLPNAVLTPAYGEYCQENGLPRLKSREFAEQMKKERFTAANHRLSNSEIEKFQRMGFSVTSPCRGWWCNGVTPVTDKFTLTNKNAGKDIEKEIAVTSVTPLHACDLNELSEGR